MKYYRPLSNPTCYIEAMLQFFSRLKDEDISPIEYINYVKNLKENLAKNRKNKELEEFVVQQFELAEAYEKFQDLLIKEGKVDFGNQFYLTLKLFREHPLILKKYQRIFMKFLCKME